MSIYFTLKFGNLEEARPSAERRYNGPSSQRVLIPDPNPSEGQGRRRVLITPNIAKALSLNR